MSGRIVGRYAIHSEFASGGMAAVYFGRLLGAAGFARTVAIKCLHPQFARDPDFVAMFLDEARLAARIRHPNVVQTLDVVQAGREIFLVMDYVHGESLANLLKRAQARGQKVPVAIATKIIQHALFGLEAAHDATNERGELLNLVHRDMSPHNVLVGADGVARVLDFGIAKAGGRAQVTRDGQLKGKLSYLAPEQLNSEHEIDRRADVYAAAATLWETLTGRRLVQGESDWQRVTQICAGELVPPSRVEPSLPRSIDAIVMKGLARNPADRYATAREMAQALDAIGAHASARTVGEWVAETGGEMLRMRAAHVAAIESRSVASDPASFGDEPTLTRASESGVIVAESSANLGSAPAAMARTLAPAGDGGTGRRRFASMTTETGAVLRVPLERTREAASDAPPVADAAPEAPQGKRPRALLLLPLPLLLIGATYVFYTHGPRTTRAEEAARGTASSAAVVPAAPRGTVSAGMREAAPVSAPPASAPPSSAATSATASATTASASPPTAATSVRAVRPGRPWKPSQPSAAPAPRSAAAQDPAGDCDVPYTIDSDGIRHPKPQCL